MKAIGSVILALGLALGVYSLTMDVGIEIPAADYGYGVKTPSMQVANVDRMAQRQNYMIFAGILSVVGAILVGFGAINQKVDSPIGTGPKEPLPKLNVSPAPLSTPISVSICPSCKFMGEGDATSCTRCNEPFTT